MMDDTNRDRNHFVSTVTGFYCLPHPHPISGGESWPGDVVSVVVLQKVASKLHPKVRNHGEGPY